MDYTKLADKVVKHRLEEQELMLAKYILDNPDADMSKIMLVSYWDYKEPYKYITEVVTKK